MNREQAGNGNNIITLSFLGFLVMISIISAWMPKKAFSERENRYLKQKPEFTMEGLLDGSYGLAYEEYLSDQFPARNSWIGVKVLAERMQGKQEVNGVYFGKDDYLIERFDREQIASQQLGKNLESLIGFVKTAGEILGEGRVQVMLAPSASQVLKEKLPWLASPYDQSQVTEYLVKELGEGQVVMVEEELRAHKDQEIYYKTDHHWTALGAYYGYRKWAQDVGITPWSQDAFEQKTVSEDFLGTVYSKVNVAHKPDSIQLYLPKEPVSYRIFYDGAREPGPMYQEEALKGKDKYSVYMDGNHGLTEVYTEAGTAEAGRRLLVIKDSFAHSFLPFAVNHFEETYMIDLRYFNGSVHGLMEEHGITDVLVLYQIPGFAKEKTVSKLSR